MTTQKTHLLLMGAIAIALAGCGSSGGNNNTVDNSTGNTSGATSGSAGDSTGGDKATNQKKEYSSVPRVANYRSYTSDISKGEHLVSISIGGKTYEAKGSGITINFADLPLGLQEGDMVVTTNKSKLAPKEHTYHYRLLNGKYATVFTRKTNSNAMRVTGIFGDPTTQVSNNIKAHYEGTAFNSTKQGKFSYDIDYSTGYGEGQITGFLKDDIKLRRVGWRPTMGAAKMGVKEVTAPHQNYFTFNNTTSDGGVYYLYLLGDMDSVAGLIQYKADKDDVALMGDLVSSEIVKKTGKSAASSGDSGMQK